MNDPPSSRRETGAIAFAWWNELQGNNTAGIPDPKRRQDRQALAQLRRCRTPVEALSLPDGVGLALRFGLGRDDARLRRAGAVAAVLAHVRGNAPMELARAIGRRTIAETDSALLGEGRFRRLLQVDDPDELMTAMVRLVRHLKGEANVADLARSILYWGDRVRQRWAFDYYAAGLAAPAAGAADTRSPETLREGRS